MNKKYSVWQKVDLHIHTDWSKKTKANDYKGLFSVESLMEKLKHNDVRIFSMTDHNIINLPAYKEYYDLYNSETDPLLLLGIELDIQRNERTYHSLLIFNCSDSVYAEDINDRLERKFLSKAMPLLERKLTIDEIIDTFPGDDFFFIPHAGNTSSIVDGYKGEIEEAQKMLILFQSPLEKVPEKSRQIYNHNFDKVLYEAFRNKDDYAYIEFSDNHNIEKYPCKHKGDMGDHEFYYIKGSKNFETLRLAFIDPKSRIKSSVGFHSISQPRNYLDSLKLNSSTQIQASTLNFSAHLNVIIGGRSSGKSLLMDILNRGIAKLKIDSKYDSIQKDLNAEIKSKFDTTFKNKTSVETSIIQINQGDIVNFFEKSKLEDLARKTDKLEAYNEAKENIVVQKNVLKGIVENLQSAYKEAFEIDISQKIVIHKHTIEKYLSKEYLFKVDIAEIKNRYDSEDTLKNNEDLISSLIDHVEKLKISDYFVFTEDENQKILDFEEIIKIKKVEIDKEISARKQIEFFLNKVKDNIHTANSTLNTEGQEKAIAQESIRTKINNTKKIFSNLIRLKQIVIDIDKYNLTHVEEIELDSESKLCLEVCSDDKIKDLIIDGIKDANNQNLYLCLLKLLNGDCRIKNYPDNTPENLAKKINTQLKHLFDCFDKPNDFLEYKDGTSSKSNSPGYNSEKYLQVILNNPSSNLILIDQPEDNLGNRFISETLVDLIRDLKFKKQLFLVTHNPAIVVYGDAESIILAENDNNKISYRQIKLEDESSQRGICSVLDGGEYIFDNRARKYNIQKLLNIGV